MLEAYGVWVEKSMYGRKYMGIERVTLLIGRDGTVAQVWPKVKVRVMLKRCSRRRRRSPDPHV